MSKDLITEIKEHLVELKDMEDKANQLKKERPNDEGYFNGLSTGHCYSRVWLEELLRRHGSNFPNVTDGEFTEVNHDKC